MRVVFRIGLGLPLFSACNAQMMNGAYLASDPITGVHVKAPAHRGEFFDVYSDNISTRYSEVYWTMQPSIDLPADFVQRFDGKVVAFTGYECDSVWIASNGTEVSVPINQQYNHHHNAYILGKAAKMVRVGAVGSDTTPTHGGMQEEWEPRVLPGSAANDAIAAMQDIPDVPIMHAGFFVDGNGGEYRKSFHAVAPGFAELVASPATFRLQPMMINTRNPSGEGGVGGPLPVESAAPPGAEYSGLLECPCTDRKVKVITNHDTRLSGLCETAVGDAAHCFVAAAELGLTPLVRNLTVSDATNFPVGCSVTATQAGYEVMFNTNAASRVQCGPSNHSQPVRATGAEVIASTGNEVALDLNEGVNCTAATLDLSGAWEFAGSAKFPDPYSVTFTAQAANPDEYSVTCAGNACCSGGCEGFLNRTSLTFTMTKGFALTAVLNPADLLSMTWSNTAVWERRPPCAGAATITLSGPDGVWFGAGFGAGIMKGTYAVVVDGKGQVEERLLGDHSAGIALSSSVSVVSNTVEAGRRTVVVTRPLAGATSQHYSFQAEATGVDVISAVGDGPTLSYHKARGSSTLMLVDVGSPLCVCNDGVSGSIDGVAFRNKCQPQPVSDMAFLENPVCSIETYPGGLKCCSHQTLLLDSNQTVPPEVFTYRMKFRFYYEEYGNTTTTTTATTTAKKTDTPSSSSSSSSSSDDAFQKNAFFMFHINAPGAGEYDIPKCAEGTPVEDCVYTTTSVFRVRDSMRACSTLADPWCAAGWNETSNVLLLRAGTHCHAPACIGTDLYVCPIDADQQGFCNESNAEMLCSNRPTYGPEVAVPGDGDRYSEPGYLNIPPCLWGFEGGDNATAGAPPQLALDRKLFMVKRVNSTNAHYGVMGQWQMRGAWAHQASTPK